MALSGHKDYVIIKITLSNFSVDADNLFVL